MKRGFLFGAMFIFASTAGCSSEALPEFEGSFRERRVIGGTDAEAAGAPMLEMPSSVRYDTGSDRVWVLDTGRKAALGFDGSGTGPEVVGKPGRGPGELGMATAFDVDDSGTLWIADTGNGKVAGFRNGEVVSEFQVDHAPLGIVAVSDSVLWVTGDLMRSLLIRYDTAGNRLGAVGVPEDTGRSALRSNQGVAARGQGECAVAWAYAYRSVLACFAEDGSRLWRTEGPVPVAWDKNNDPYNMTQKDRYAYVDIATNKDRVYALFVAKGNRSRTDQVHVFDIHTGEFLGRQTLPTPARHLVLHGNKLVTSDSDPEPVIREYDVSK
jgi:hypothetical protein